MHSGRPRDQAPEGYATVRETAEVLGVSEQAIRQRIARGTLPAKTELTASGEERYYVSRQALRNAKSRQTGLASREDTGEVLIHQEELVRSILDELEKNFIELSGQITRQRTEVTSLLQELKSNQEDMCEIIKRGNEVVQEAVDRDQRYQQWVIKMTEEQFKKQAERQAERHAYRRRVRREYRTIAYVAIGCLILIIGLVIVDLAVVDHLLGVPF